MPPIKRRPPEKPVDNKKAIKNILFLLKDYKLKLFITFICALLSPVFSIIAPLLIGMATTTIFDGLNAIATNTGTMDLNKLLWGSAIIFQKYIFIM